MNNITIEVKGPAGVGTSVIAQLVAMSLQKLDIEVATDLSVNLCKNDELQVAIDNMIETNKQVLVTVAAA